MSWQFFLCARHLLALDRSRLLLMRNSRVSLDSRLTALRRLHDEWKRTTGFGFDTSVTGFLNKRFGIEGNFDGHFKTKTFNLITCQALGCPPPSFSAHISSFNFMGGPHFRFQTTNSKVTPYVHALAGGNHSRASSSFVTGTDSETDFALKLGGGVDFGLTTHTGIRLSADYNPIFQKSNGNLNPNFGSNRTRNDAVFSVGIVFK